MTIPQFTAGQVLTAAELNAMVDEINLGGVTATGATVATSQTTTSLTYTDLTTVGPAVTVTTGTKVLVFISAQENSPNGQECFMDFAVSGATTRAATDTTALISRDDSSNHRMRATAVTLLTVTAGSNTFTAKYKMGGSTGTFLNRDIVVVTL